MTHHENEDPEGLADTLELIADIRAREDIDRARVEIEAGKGIAAEELRARYLDEG
jgi:hypothetical protein